MSIGDLSWYLDLRNPQGAFASPQRDAYNKRREGENRLEAAREARLQLDREITAIRERLELEKESALGVAEISGSTKDWDAKRQAGTNRTNAEILAGTVLPANTESTIKINTNNFDNQGNLVKTVAGAVGGLQKQGVDLRTGAMDKFLPLVTDQITRLQAGPGRLAERAIESQETMAREDREFVKDIWHLQNPKLGFGQRFINAAPGLATAAAAALLAFS